MREWDRCTAQPELRGFWHTPSLAIHKRNAAAVWICHHSRSDWPTRSMARDEPRQASRETSPAGEKQALACARGRWILDPSGHGGAGWCTPGGCVFACDAAARAWILNCTRRDRACPPWLRCPGWWCRRAQRCRRPCLGPSRPLRRPALRSKAAPQPGPRALIDLEPRMGPCSAWARPAAHPYWPRPHGQVRPQAAQTVAPRPERPLAHEEGAVSGGPSAAELQSSGSLSLQPVGRKCTARST